MKRVLLAAVLAIGLVLGVSDRGVTQEVSTPVPVQEEIESVGNPLEQHYEMLFNDFAFSFYAMSNDSLYEKEIEPEDYVNLFMIGYKVMVEEFEKAGNTGFMAEEEMREDLQSAFEIGKEAYAENPSAFYGRENIATIGTMNEILMENILSKINVFVDAESDGSADVALYRAFEAIAESMGDHYAAFIPPQDTQDFVDSMEGNIHLSGIGAIIDTQRFGNSLTVINTITGSPAFMSGIQPGDQIVKIDGQSIVVKKPEDFEPTIDRIKGEAGTTVNLEILRGEKTLTFAIDRAVIDGSVANAYKHGDYLHVVLSKFSSTAAQDIRRAIDLASTPGSPYKGIVLDFRENPGGVLTASVDIYDMFDVANITVVTSVGHHIGDGEEVPSEGRDVSVLKTEDNAAIKVPLVILINAHSASASELLSGSMQDNGRAYIIGETSYGKGIVQSAFPTNQETDNPSLVKFTTAEYFVGKDRERIHHLGVTPDLKVDQKIPTEVKDGKAKQHSYMVKLINRSDPDNDPVLKAGLDYLESQQ